MDVILILIVIFAVLFTVISRVYNSAEGKGKRGESSIESIIERRLDDNVYTAKCFEIYFCLKADGGTSEVDVLFVCNKGHFCIESKNYMVGYLGMTNTSIGLCHYMQVRTG